MKCKRSSCKAATVSARCDNTARWLMEPLSVISPLSMVGGSDNKHMRAMRLALPVDVFDSSLSTFWKCANTGSLLNTIHTDTPTHERQLVDVVTLDRALNIGESRSLILMDVEGYELEALKGAPNLLRQRHYWLVEILSNHVNDYPYSGVFDLMEANDYEAWGVDEVNKDFKQVALETAREIDRGKRKTTITNYLFIPRGDKLVQKLRERQKP